MSTTVSVDESELYPITATFDSAGVWAIDSITIENGHTIVKLYKADD